VVPCPFCGSEMIFGKQAEDLIGRIVARGTSREDAEKYVKYPNHSTYTECPTPGRHKDGNPMVPVEELEHGAYYFGSCRNARVARRNAETKRFVYVREKFGQVFCEDIGYWVAATAGEHRFDEYKPYCKTESPPFEIPLTTKL
jgi:hypothetical protein